MLKLAYKAFVVVVGALAGAAAAHAQLGGFQCPLAGKPAIRQGDAVASEGGRFNSNRGSGNKHGALDLNSTLGAQVKAAHAGRVAVAQKNWGQLGNTVIIDHLEGAYTVYGHLDLIKVAEGATVQAGREIGTVGYSGNAGDLKSKGLPPHLHFALIIAGKAGLADKDMPLRKMEQWGDFWKSNFDAQLTGAVDPVLFMVDSKACWTGSTSVGAPGEK